MDPQLTLEEHLNELRGRLSVVIGSLLVACFASFPFAVHVLKLVTAPGHGVMPKLAFFSPQEAFMVYIKLTIFCGLTIVLPIILYEFWAFVSPAIEQKTRRYTVGFVFFSFLAFAAGGMFAYFVLIPTALQFLMGFAGDELQPVISVDKYISFVVGLIIGCGLVFEMPIASFILSKAGIVNHKLLRNKYKYAVLVIFIASAVITPTSDIFNMMLLSVPMLLLYEISIWVSRLASPDKKRLLRKRK